MRVSGLRRWVRRGCSPKAGLEETVRPGDVMPQVHRQMQHVLGFQERPGSPIGLCWRTHQRFGVQKRRNNAGIPTLHHIQKRKIS